MKAKTLKALTWNIHCQSGVDSCDIPDWVEDEIVNSNVDIAILTEFSTDVADREKFTQVMQNLGYQCVTSENKGGNDILIAVKRSYPITHVAWTACYGHDDIPENLRVDINVGGENERIITVVGVRIKEVRSYNHAALVQARRVDVEQAEKRLAECRMLLNWTAGLEHPVIIGGDFNTYRTETCVQQWNGHVLQKLADAAGFQMACPERGNSVFAEKDPRAFQYDRFLVKGLSAIGESTYDRGFVVHAPHIYHGSNNLIGIIPGFPDHAILQAEFELS